MTYLEAKQLRRAINILEDLYIRSKGSYTPPEDNNDETRTIPVKYDKETETTCTG